MRFQTPNRVWNFYFMKVIWDFLLELSARYPYFCNPCKKEVTLNFLVRWMSG